MEGAWNFTIQRKCIDYISYLYASSAVNVLTDIALCVLPLPYFWKLDLTRKQRAILCMLLAGGARYVHSYASVRYVLIAISACVVGIIRIGVLHQLKVMDTTCKKAFLLANYVVALVKIPKEGTDGDLQTRA